MKRFSYGFVAILLLAGCDSPTEPGSLEPIFSTTELSDDAALLALREMATRDSLAAQPVTIDAALIDLMRDLLLAVRDAPLAAADSATAMYPIRAKGEAWQIVVDVEHGAPEVQPWRDGARETGIASLDSLVRGYDLDLERWYDWEFIGVDAFIFRSPTPLNLLALGARFELAPVVVDAWPDASTGPFTDIRAVRGEGDHWMLTYWLFWGDCMAGCYMGHYWTFDVDPAGAVRFVESGGDPVMAPQDWRPSS